MALSVCILVVALLLGVAAPPAQAAGTGSITGTVTVTGGAPAPFATVALLTDTGYGWSWDQSTTTGALGSYYFVGLEATSYRIEFMDWSGAYLTQYYNNKPTVALADDVAVTVGATTSGIDATLAAAGHISGTVTNASAAGLGGIQVTAYRSDGSGGWDWVNSTQTGPAGSYDLGGLDTGSYRIEFMDWSGAYLTQYYNNKATIDLGNDVAVTAPATTSNINATLAAPGHVTGTVKNASAAALGGIRVTAYRSNGSGGWDRVNSTQTAAAGSYDLGGLSTGSYRIAFRDSSSGTYLTQYYDNKSTLSSANDVAVTAGETTANIDATLLTGGHITGTVKNASDAGLGGIWVTAYRPNGSGGWDNINSTSTAADGVYDLGGLDTGTYRVRFTDDSDAYLAQWFENKLDRQSATDVAVTAGETTANIDATLATPGHISGTVRNASAAGLGDISVYAYRPNGSGGWDYINSTSTAADGVYDLGGLDTGTYRVRFTDDSGDYTTQWFDNKPDRRSADDVKVTAGETSSGVNATLAATGHIVGTVTDTGSAGLGGIWVTAYRSDGSSHWDYVSDTSTNATSGAYDLGRLDAGSYKVRFYDGAGTYATQYFDAKSSLDSADEVVVNAGETTDAINAMLPLAGHITGTIKDSSGGVPTGIQITAYGENGSGGWDYVDDCTTNATTGYYDIGRLGAGTYRVGFIDHSGTYITQYYDNKPTLSSADDVAVTAGGIHSGIDATLATAGHITGTVKNASDAGLGDIWVTAYRSNGSGGWDYVDNTLTNATSGAYDLGGLDTGTYRVRFSDDSDAYLTQWFENKPDLGSANDVAVVAGETTSGVNATLVTAAVFNAISVTAPTGSGSQAQGSALPVTWSANAAVDAGQFSIWVVSPANGWYVGKIVPASGASLDYSDSVDLNVPVDAGYRVFVYYRGASGDPWGIYGMSPGTVDVTAAFNAISVTAPTGSGSQAQGSALPVTWSANQPVGTGQFSIWVVSPANGWYVGKIVPADGDSADYSDTVDLNVPVDLGYRVYVFYRAVSGDPWSIYDRSPGSFDVTATFNAISVTAPTGSGSQAQGDSLPVTWSANAAVATGQFSIWVVSPANGWYVGKIVPADGDSADYSDTVDLNVPLDSGYRVFVYYRATSGDPWSIYDRSPGSFDVTGPFSAISVTAPTGSGSQAQGSALTVDWRANAAVDVGEFSIWVVSPANGWYVGQIVPASGASRDYSDSVDLNVPVDAGYRVFVYYRPVAGSGAWDIYGMSPGTVDVTAAE